MSVGQRSFLISKFFLDRLATSKWNTNIWDLTFCVKTLSTEVSVDNVRHHPKGDQKHLMFADSWDNHQSCHWEDEREGAAALSQAEWAGSVDAGQA